VAFNLTDVVEEKVPGTTNVRVRTKSHWHHAYYVKIGMTDIDKMRDEAVKYAAGDQYNEEGVCSIIHHHRLLDNNEETSSCEGQKHEVFHKKDCPHGQG
jgi:hypothetical protein